MSENGAAEASQRASHTRLPPKAAQWTLGWGLRSTPLHLGPIWFQRVPRVPDSGGAVHTLEQLGKARRMPSPRPRTRGGGSSSSASPAGAPPRAAATAAAATPRRSPKLNATAAAAAAATPTALALTDDPTRSLSAATRIVKSTSLLHAETLLSPTRPAQRLVVPIPSFRPAKKAKITTLPFSPNVRRSERIMDKAPSPGPDGRYARIGRRFFQDEGSSAGAGLMGNVMFAPPKPPSPIRSKKPPPRIIVTKVPAKIKTSAIKAALAQSKSSRASAASKHAPPSRTTSPTPSNNNNNTTHGRTRSRTGSSGSVRTPRTLRGFRITLTSLPSSETDRLQKAAERLGATVLANVDEPLHPSSFATLTHVVVGTPRRTLKVVAGIASGAWIVSSKWLEACVAKGGWVDETPFELHERFPGALVCRRGARLLDGCTVCVRGNTNPPADSLSELVRVAGGATTDNPDEADVVIAPAGLRVEVRNPRTGRINNRTRVFQEVWLIDKLERGEPFS